MREHFRVCRRGRHGKYVIVDSDGKTVGWMKYETMTSARAALAGNIRWGMERLRAQTNAGSSESNE